MERASAQLTQPVWARSLLAWVPISLAILCACANGKGKTQGSSMMRQAEALPERTTGCVDTPFLGPDARSMSSGIQCGRAPSDAVNLVRGRVIQEAGPGLPGPGLEGMRLSVHAIDGPLRLDALPPVIAEVRSGPQGEFSVSIESTADLVVVVRQTPQGPALATRRLDAGEIPENLVILIPAQVAPQP